MKSIKGIANQISFVLSVVCLFTFISLILFDPSTNHNLTLYLMVLATVAFVIGVVGIPFERKNEKKQVVKSVFSIIFSFFLALGLAILWVLPVFFPFGIPGIYP
ncbi:hypothetical protein CYL18_17215 [Pradoshia eiseniae]|uniref:Uncharacterized protein n=1 Tax=Pradoshia eiseniae TaxID=2064768 RepID=A0A2S7MVX8_9BACI|nr:hypothetical protein [Pradoshia eiseniae]PQD93898.1 hypothetical protein CYL18_17215 [Pradoshia eiseniae]